MQHLRALDQIRLKNTALAIGSFDGVHRGHQDLIARLHTRARDQGWQSVVLTFYPHPSVVLRERTPAFYISTPEEKAELLSELGVDFVITQKFDLELSRVEAPEFLARLTQQLGFGALWAGEDFAIGYQRRGNRHFLQKASEEQGFEFHLVEPFKLEGEIVSSTRVRESLRSGDVARVAKYLGRPFELPGIARQGAGRGRQLGIPTANLELWEERAYPARGVYACYASVGDRRLQAVTNIGLRPTFEDELEAPIVEAHLLDFNEELYGEEVRLTFVDRLRDERKFEGPQALLEQIERDVSRAREILRRSD
jgi:riboflavin kinase/FMN adenylyltransferase